MTEKEEIKNKEELSTISIAAAHEITRLRREESENFLKKMSIKASKITEDILNEEIGDLNPIEKMIMAKMIYDGINHVGALESKSLMNDHYDIKIEEQKATETIRQTNTGYIADKIEFDSKFVEIKKVTENE